MILVVDDHQETRRYMVKLLAFKGFHAATAASGKEALDMVKDSKPTLILLDVMMPGMNGLDVARALRADPANDQVRILFLTAAGYPSTDKQAELLGASGVVTKPIPDIDAFLDRLQTFVAPPN